MWASGKRRHAGDPTPAFQKPTWKPKPAPQLAAKIGDSLEEFLAVATSDLKLHLGARP